MNAQQYFTAQRYLNAAYRMGETASVHPTTAINPFPVRSALAEQWELGFEQGERSKTIEYDEYPWGDCPEESAKAYTSLRPFSYLEQRSL